MNSVARLLSVAPALALMACNPRSESPPLTTPEPDRARVASPSIDERLLADLDSRRQWPTTGVKIRLARPIVVTTVTSSQGAQLTLIAERRIPPSD